MAQSVDPQMQQQAQQLCSIVVGTLAFGQYNPQQIFGQASLQVIMQVTNGTGIFQPLQQLGQVAQLTITNPHIDQDQQYGQLLHFYCTSTHQQGAIDWEIKYAPGTNMIEYVTLQNAQPPGQQPSPYPQPGPQTQPGPYPQPGPQPGPQLGPQLGPQAQPYPSQKPFPQPGPQAQQNPFPQPGPPQSGPQMQQNPFPQPGPQPGTGADQQPGGTQPSRDEACQMFPGMC